MSKNDLQLPIDVDRMTVVYGGCFKKASLEQGADGKWSRNSEVQRTTKDGVPIWEVVAHQSVGSRMEEMRVSIADAVKPEAEKMAEVTFTNLRASFFARKNGGVGAEYWADEMVPVMQVAKV